MLIQSITIKLYLCVWLLGLWVLNPCLPYVRSPTIASFYDACDNGEKKFVNDFSCQDGMNLEGGPEKG